MRTQKGFVGTEIGPLEVILIRGDLALVSTGAGAPVRIREQDFQVSVRFSLTDGTWTMLDEGHGSSRVKYWSMYKLLKPVPPTFAAKAEAAALKALTEFTAANPPALLAAEVEHREKQADDALKAYEKLIEELAQAELKLGEAQSQLAMAKAAHQAAMAPTS